MSRATIAGYIDTSHGPLSLSDMLGIYADRATPCKPGHWIKIRSESSAKGLVKVYVEGLTMQQRRLIEAAGRFNQLALLVV
jgi:hypothetical protein